MGNLNGIAGRDVAEYRRFGIAPSRRLRPRQPTRGRPQLPAPAGRRHAGLRLALAVRQPGAGAAPAISTASRTATTCAPTSISAPSRSSTTSTTNVTLRDQFRYANYDRAIRVTEPQVVYAGSPTARRSSQIIVNRNMIAVNSTETFLQNQTDVTARFDTGPLRSHAGGRLRGRAETSSPVRITYDRRAGTNLLTPNAASRSPASGATIASITNAGSTRVAATRSTRSSSASNGS